MVETTGTEGQLADVDGVRVGGSPRASRGAQGGPPPGAPTARPEDGIPELIRQQYAAKQQADTGVTYASHQGKFLNWLKTNSLHFGNMPPGTAQRFLTETIPNPITRNVGYSALKVMFDVAANNGIQFAPQEISRTKTPRKRAAPEVAAMPSAPGVPMAPTPVAVTTFPAPSQTPAAAPASAPVEAPAKAAAQRPTIFPSLGTRIQVYKVADHREAPMIQLGHEIPIGNPYQREQIEAEGSLEGFIMRWIRPVHGPFLGEMLRLYRLRLLDTAGQPIKGHHWDVPVGPSDAPGPMFMGHPGMGASPMMPGAGHNTMQGGQQFGHMGWQQPQQPAQPVAPTPANVVERVLAMTLEQQKEQTAKYDALVKELTEKNRNGQMDGTTMMLLLERNKPQPIDVDAVVAKVMASMPQPAPAPAPARGGGDALGDLFGPAPAKGPDPAITAILEGQKQQTELLGRLVDRMFTQNQQPQRDPFDVALRLVEVMKPAAPTEAKRDPLVEQLAGLALKQVSEPPKAKTLTEVLAEYKAIKELTEGNQPAPSPLEGLFDTINNLIDNSDKVGEAIGKLKAGALKGALSGGVGGAQRPQQRTNGQGQQPQRPAQTTAKPPQGQGQAPAAKPAQQPNQPVPPPPELQEAVLAMVKTPEGEGEEELLVQGLWHVIETLGKLGGPWAQAAEKVLKLYKEANSRAEVQLAITNLFRWVGAQKLLQDPKHVERLTRVLHMHYTEVYKLLTGGTEKVLPDAPVPPAPPAEEPPSEEDDDDEGEEEEPSEPGEGGGAPAEGGTDNANVAVV